MYRYTVHTIKDAGELVPPSGYQLHSVVYAFDKLVCVWVNDPRYFEVGWGETTWAKADEPVISGLD